MVDAQSRQNHDEVITASILIGRCNAISQLTVFCVCFSFWAGGGGEGVVKGCKI